MVTLMHRRTLLSATAAGFAALPIASALRPAFAQGWDAGLTDFDKVFGADDAPVTLIEYASFTCGHCANFHNETLPELTQTYIDTGSVRFVFRDFPLDGVALRAGMLARCLPDSAYKPMLDLIFQQQREWARADDPVLALVSLARNAGLSESAAQACLADEDLAVRIVEMRQEGIDRYGVNSTPTFVLEGETFAGALSFEEMAARIDAVLPAN